MVSKCTLPRGKSLISTASQKEANLSTGGVGRVERRASKKSALSTNVNIAQVHESYISLAPKSQMRHSSGIPPSLRSEESDPSLSTDAYEIVEDQVYLNHSLKKYVFDSREQTLIRAFVLELRLSQSRSNSCIARSASFLYAGSHVDVGVYLR